VHSVQEQKRIFDHHAAATISFMEAKLLLVPWIVAVVYSSIPPFWFVIHPFAARWRGMKRSPYRALLPLWAAMILAIAWITWVWHEIRFYSLPWMWIPAALLLLCGLGTYRKVFSEFGGHKLSGEAELRPEEHAQTLVTSGLHARMRHPIYFAHLCNLAGWALGSGLVVCFVLLGINLLITFPLMICMEERELERRFGENFRNYKARVGVLPPLWFARSSKRLPNSEGQA
jgi:protein-S-isoprenylcysteine O-methyltransferase Ste14